MTSHAAARSCPASAEPTPREWLVAGLAQSTVDGPAVAAPALRRVLETSVIDTNAAEVFPWLGHLTVAAAYVVGQRHRAPARRAQVTATRELGVLTMLPLALNTLAKVSTIEGDLDGAASAMAEANQILEVTGGNAAFAGAYLGRLAR